MFDSAPPNLPIEPAPKPAPVPLAPQMPSSAAPVPASAVAPPTVMTTAGKKEPEDIFSGMEAGGPVVRTPPSAPYVPSRRGFPWRVIAIVIVVIALIGSIGGAIYVYFTTYAPAAPTPVASPASSSPTNQQTGTELQTIKKIETPPPAAVAPTEPPAPVTPPAAIPLPTPVTTTAPVISILPPTSTAIIAEGKDSDADQLTDVEEPYYGSDMLKADTNGNSYLDGVEVRNLYDPAKKGAKLADAAYMSHPAWGGWTFLLPKPWSIVNDARDQNKATISTGSATRFSLERFPKTSSETLDQWLTKNGVTATKIVKMKSGLDARQTEDGLTTYIVSGDSVLRVAYDLSGDKTYEYRTSYFMVVNTAALTVKK